MADEENPVFASAKKTLEHHHDALVRVLGDKYLEDPRYLGIVQEVAEGRTPRNAIADRCSGI